MKNGLSIKTIGKNNLPEVKTPKPIWVTVALIALLGWTGLLAWQSYLSYLPMPRGFGILPELFSLSRFGPFQSSLFISHWLGTLKIYALLLGYGVGTLGVGLFILKRIFPGVRSRLETVLIGFALGFAALSLGTFFLGVLGGYHVRIFVWVYAVFVTFGAVNLWKQRAVLKATPGWWLGAKPPRVDWVLGVIIILVIISECLIANAPELFYDSLEYHIGVPAQWICHGGITAMPTVFFSNLPMGIQMLYTGALMLADERLCRLLHVALGVLTVLTVFALGRNWFGRRVAFWASGIFITIPVVILNAVVSGVDVGTTFFTSASLLILFKAFFLKSSIRNEFLLAGVLAGMALSCKYNAALVLLPTIILTSFFYLYQEKRFSKYLVHMSGFIGGVLISLVFWLGKNFIITGNPIFPFLNKLIHTRYISPDKLQWLTNDGLSIFGINNLVQSLRAPWDLTFGTLTNSSFVGVIFLFFLPAFLWLGAMARKAKWNQNLFFFSALASMCVWASQTQNARYLLPGFPFLTVLFAYVLQRTEQWNFRVGEMMRWCLLGLIAWMLLNTAIFAQASWDFLGVSLGLRNREVYLDQKMLTSYRPMSRLVNQLPDNVKIFAFGEARVFYFEKPITSVTINDDNPLIEWLDQGPTAEAVWIKLRRAGYTHLYVHAQEAVRTRGFESYRWTPEAITRWQELIDRYMHRIIKLQQQSLYLIRSEPDMRCPIKSGRPLFTFDMEVVAVANKQSDLALRLMQHGQWVEAEAAWQSISKLAPMWEVPYTMLAWMYQQQQKNNEALLMYQHAESLADLAPDMYHDLGVLYWTMGRRNEAIDAMKAAVAQAPGFVRAVEDLKSMEKTMQQIHRQ